MEIQDREIGFFFDDCAREGFMESFSPEEEDKLRELFYIWNITPGQRICEPGCGSGRLTERIERAVGNEGMVYACDLSEAMISRAQERNMPDYVRFVRGSADSIQTDNDYFDKIICLNVFPHFSNPSRALAEMHRVLKPGGHLWINHFKSRSEVNETHRHASSVIISHQMSDDETMKKLLTDAGFDVVELRDSGEKTGYSLHAVKRNK